MIEFYLNTAFRISRPYLPMRTILLEQDKLAFQNLQYKLDQDFGSDTLQGHLEIDTAIIALLNLQKCLATGTPHYNVPITDLAYVCFAIASKHQYEITRKKNQTF